MRSFRLSSSLPIAFGILLGCAVLFPLFLNTYKNVISSDEQKQKAIRIAAQSINNGVAEAMLVGNTYYATRLLAAACTELGAVHCTLRNENHEELFAYPSKHPDRNARQHEHRLLHGGKPVGRVVFEYAPESLWHLLSRQVLMVFVFVILLIAVSFTLFRFLIQRPYRDLLQLVRLSSNESLEGAIGEMEKFHTPVEEFRELVDGLRTKLARVKVKEKEDRQAAQLMALGDLSKQVAHDIRSPLTALKLVAEDLPDGVGESERVLIRGAIARIHDIANELLGSADRAAASGELIGATVARSPSAQHVWSLVDSLVSEKRSQYRGVAGIEIGIKAAPEAYLAFANISPSEFKTVLSNLIDNSVESIGERGFVSVQINAEFPNVVIRVRDNGRGIPDELLSKVTEKGFSYGKVGGSGLGLYKARTVVEAWSGHLKVNSRVGQGTEVQLTLPMESAPPWFCSRVDLRGIETVVVVDDDHTIHEVWGRKCAGRVGALVHCYGGTELQSWLAVREGAGVERVLFLVDYELRNESSGLSWIQRLGIERNSILVTSRSEEPRVVERCLAMGITVLPKNLAPHIEVLHSMPPIVSARSAAAADHATIQL